MYLCCSDISSISIRALHSTSRGDQPLYGQTPIKQIPPQYFHPLSQLCIRSLVPSHWATRDSWCLAILRAAYSAKCTPSSGRQSALSLYIVMKRIRIFASPLQCWPGLRHCILSLGRSVEHRKLSSSTVHDDQPPSPICHEALARMVEAARRPLKRGPRQTGLSRTHSDYLYRSTLRGWSVIAASGAFRRDRDKGRQGNIDANHLLDLVLEQGGLCAYSGIPMEMLRPNSHWRVSVERVDNSRGYLKGNCCLIAAEFNSAGSAQWSKQKVQEVLHVRTEKVHLQRLQEGTAAARLRQGRGRTKYTGFRGPDGDGNWRCGCCGIWKDNMQFFARVASANGLRHQCKECSWNQKATWMQTMRGHALRQLCNARNRAANRERSGTFNLDFDDILNMLWTQGGRCYYSGVPLHCAAGPADWVWSIERLDNSVTYTRKNCVLIAREFQTPDYSRNTAKNPVFGTAQWSRSKASHVWGPYYPHYEALGCAGLLGLGQGITPATVDHWNGRT